MSPESIGPTSLATSPTVLVIEDEENLLAVLVYSLEQRGYRTSVARDGVSGLKLAQQADPDVIILDVNLPEMNGYDVCRRIRGQADVPILMLSVRSEEVDRVEGLDSGASEYMVKPFSLRDLLAKTETLLRDNR